MKSSRQLILWVALLLCTYFGVDLLRETIPYGIRINTSDSLPYWVFLSKPFKSVQRGDYVSFQHPLNRMNLVKRVVGLPGDRIERAGDYLLCGGFNCGQVLFMSPSGKLMTPVNEQIIPDGCVFVHATHPESFDSRYEDFGFVRIGSIEEQLWPLF